jgi:hypothetical protein
MAFKLKFAHQAEQDLDHLECTPIIALTPHP